jgi:pyruvate kinase
LRGGGLYNARMIIRTKIVATVGPACGGVEVLRDLARAGADVFRINFSHGSDEQHGEFLQNVRAVEEEIGEPLAVMGDLCGPKIRVGDITGGGVLLGEGQELIIQREPIEGTVERVSTTLGELVDAVDVGQIILLDDGKLRLEVAEAAPPEQITCRVLRGGVLASGKGVNLPNTALRLSALTEKDRRDAAWIAGRDFDYVALSFVRSADDVRELRLLLDRQGCDARIVAKIEKPQALEHVEEILDAADAVMVARGDLGVEMDLPAVPVAQKRIARLAQSAGKCCIIATQMLETMTHAPTPTRAEVSDVANAVLDHGDAVMLSGETAVGEFPVAAVRMMNEIVRETQAYHDETAEPVRLEYAPARTAAALAAAVREVMAVEDVAAVAVYTATGTTARMLAKSRLPRPILALAADRRVVRRMCLYYGVAARRAKAPEHTRDVLKLAEQFALELGVAKKGDRLVVVSGRPIGQAGATNTLVVHEIP